MDNQSAKPPVEKIDMEAVRRALAFMEGRRASASDEDFRELDRYLKRRDPNARAARF